jgi:hypothetical protein
MAGWTTKAAVLCLATLAGSLWAPGIRPAEPDATAADSAAAVEPALRPYDARYAVYRNGKLTGKAEVSLRKRGERWIMRSEGSGTHGLARILAARDTEEVFGRLLEGHFRPERYSRHTRVAGIDHFWFVTFDWKESRVSITHDGDDPLVLDMVGQSLDPLSLKLEMRQRLSQPGTPLQFQMVEEDEIDEQNFRLLPTEWMETSLGCLRTVPVEKIRENSKRFTRAWHAPDLGFVEVRIEHGKVGGNHHEMRITELSFEGAEVVPRPGCAALQAPGAGDKEAPVPNPADR